jgi:hypothetical protein
VRLIDRVCLWLGYDYSPIDGEPIYWPVTVEQSAAAREAMKAFDREIMRQYVLENKFGPYIHETDPRA